MAVRMWTCKSGSRLLCCHSSQTSAQSGKFKPLASVIRGWDWENCVQLPDNMCSVIAQWIKEQAFKRVLKKSAIDAELRMRASVESISSRIEISGQCSACGTVWSRRGPNINCKVGAGTCGNMVEKSTSALHQCHTSMRDSMQVKRMLYYIRDLVTWYPSNISRRRVNDVEGFINSSGWSNVSDGREPDVDGQRQARGSSHAQCQTKDQSRSVVTFPTDKRTAGANHGLERVRETRGNRKLRVHGTHRIAARKDQDTRGDGSRCTPSRERPEMLRRGSTEIETGMLQNVAEGAIWWLLVRETRVGSKERGGKIATSARQAEDYLGMGK
ncbi:hypothetical protein GGX14DRAFT_601167 [Mycena pura]|uniref:Uncharacterized protein n=1 Tax=Mycena pura TaxID=153505 RepID=A0AAD6UV89_9AGAR|nr:hypothetical protein GGX14DRAFT_601167 [Mycena pura]